jgi:cystathionine gamma-synthase
MSDEMSGKRYSPATIAVRGGFEHRRGDGISPPINLSSTFAQPDQPGPGEYSYGRAGSPGFEVLERALAQIEHGVDSVVFNAGMAAANAVLSEAEAGTAVLLPYDSYYGIRVGALELLPTRGIEVRLVDQANLDDVREALQGASLFWTETPTNPLMAIADLEAIGALAAEFGVPWFCDNTFATPALQNPLDCGAAGVMHSLTKYIGGHSDLILGVIVCQEAGLAARLRARRASSGTQPDGFSCWLARRGLQTMPLRVARQSESALELAKRLDGHPKVEIVFYPGLPTHPGHDTATRQMHGGFGGMLSILVKGGQAAAQRVIDRCKVWVPATSLGSVESLIERRARWADETADPALLRLSTGIEDVEDLWRDLEQALE